MSSGIKKYDWIDALRGYAILLVVMIHTSQLFPGDAFKLGWVTRLGDLGVTMFFIASCFTLFNSYQSRSQIDKKDTNKFFFIRRFFRIAPMYYAAIIFYVLLYSFVPTNQFTLPVNWINVAANVAFLNGLYLPAINYIPPGGWSVGDEMLFYLTLPFLFARIKSLNTAVYVLIGSIIASFVIQVILYFAITDYTDLSWLELRGWHLYFWFPNQFPVFCFGICLFFLIREAKIQYKEWMLGASLLLIVLLNLVPYQSVFPSFLIQREYLFGFAFCCFAYCLSKAKLHFLITPITRFGKVSFSIYLIHFAVISVVGKVFKYLIGDRVDDNLAYVIVYIIVVSVSYIAASISYQLIEKKGIAYGEYLIERMKGKTMTVPGSR